MVNFKGFERFTLSLGGRTSILVGPNNAGKSTAIGALRLSAHLLAYSKVRKPDFTTTDSERDRNIHAYRLSSAPAEFITENIAHEFREVEARVEVHFKNRAALYIVWPIEDQPYYYLEHIAGAQPPSLNVTRRDYPSVGVVQTLTPVEHRETVLSEEHIKKSIGTRLASKHFRNQLYMTRINDPDGYDEYTKFALQHTPELTSIEVARSRYNADLDLFFTEYKSRVEKEIYWAGDGLQIWLQLLFHIWRLRSCSSIILDEPDVYLHPDLQRRLVGILEDSSSQVILSTHAPEILAESSRDSVVLLDRTRRASKKVSSVTDLSALNNALGSGFNLRLAKALRSKTALFVEGKDMKILTNLAKTIGAVNFNRENGLTVIPMGGSSKRKLAESFGWVNETLLDSSVRVAVFLDRDYLDDHSVDKILEDFEAHSVFGHVWQRSELENYLISPACIARLSQLSIEQIDLLLMDAFEDLKEASYAQILTKALEKNKSSGEHPSTTISNTRDEFEKNWQVQSWRMSIIPGKDVLSKLNLSIQEAGGKAVSARALSARLSLDEIPLEMTTAIRSIEEMLAT